MTDSGIGLNRAWGGRFSDSVSDLMKEINASVRFDKRLAMIDIHCSKVHVRMLESVHIISSQESYEICDGLSEIEKEILEGTFEFSDDMEDVHMNIEFALANKIGSVAGKMHTARSRNDQVAVDFRLWVMNVCREVISLLDGIISVLLEQAEQGYRWVMPGFTHLQVAQPVTWGHHMMAYVEMFGRDQSRFLDALERMDECPLGVAALAGTSFPIDRDFTARELGFMRPTANSLDTVSDRDFAIEFMCCASLCMMHISRLAEELVLWNSTQFSFIRLSDRFLTGSSIMPQKRNPDAAELMRGKAGRVFGDLISLLTTMKGLPLSYSKDMQEDKEPVFDCGDTLLLVLPVVRGVISDIHPNRERMVEMAESAFSTATDLADWLVSAKDIPFREAHHITGRVVRCAEENGCSRLQDLSLDLMQKIDVRITSDVLDVLQVNQSVIRRASFGGTAPDMVRSQINRWRDKLADSKYRRY